MKRIVCSIAIGALLLLVGGASHGTTPPDPLAGSATWKPPEWGELRAQVLAWLESTSANAETRERVAGEWPAAEPPTVLDRLDYLVATFALADSRVAGMLDSLAAESVVRTAPDAGWLADSSTPQLVRNNCRLYLGRWAVQQQLYDEAFEYLDGLTTDAVADPAGLLFYQAVAQQRLLQKQPALQSLQMLLAGSQYVPRRYLAIAELMRSDLASLEPDSLDHIARRMDDIRRRLQFGRADKKVQEIESGVIDSLDKLIEKAQQQQQQGQQSGSPSSSQIGQPAPDSRFLPGKGAGEVTKKNIGDQSGWGNMPPKQREAALQQIGREFPAHYREAVEQYFRRLAGTENERE